MSAWLARRPLGALVLALLWFGALGSAAGVIDVEHRARALFVELERANARGDNLEIEWGQLQLEQSAWSTHAFVERIAGARLRMGTPPPAAIQIFARSGATATATVTPTARVLRGGPASPASSALGNPGSAASAP